MTTEPHQPPDPLKEGTELREIVIDRSPESIPNSAEEFLNRHRFKEILRDRNVKVYAYDSVQVATETFEEAEKIAAKLNDSFSLEDECTICLQEWDARKTILTGESILTWNHCKCEPLHCVPCSSQMLGKPCPTCRLADFDRSLVFVIGNGSDSSDSSTDSDTESLTDSAIDSIETEEVQMPCRAYLRG